MNNTTETNLNNDDLKKSTGQQCPTNHATGHACAGCDKCAAPMAIQGQSDAKSTGCSGDPACCPNNEGYGCDCAAAPAAQVLAQPDLHDIEQYRMQMAGISTASLGYWKEGDSIHPDYDTVPLRDVAKLYAKYAELHAIVHGTTAPVQAQPDLMKIADSIEEDGLYKTAGELRALAAQLGEQPVAGEVQARLLGDYTPADRAFYSFWYGHMLEDLMQPPLIGVAFSTARYIWDAALAATQPAAAPAEVKTWQERTGNHNWRHGSVKHALAEIADLRAALARHSAAPVEPTKKEG